MSTASLTIFKTVAPLAGGVNSLAGVGQQYKISVTGTWANGDEQTLVFTDSSTGLQTQVGAGNATGAVPSYVFTFDDKVYYGAGSTVYFSALDSPATLNDPAGTGNSFITLSNFYATPESQVAAEAYQGLVAFIARRTVQTWSIDPDPTKNAKQQILSNIGTFAKLSVQAIGDNDVFMLYDSGFRSLRPRVASNNAQVIDLGTPVDSLIQTTLATLSSAEKAAACGVVEPSSNRYWCYVPEHSAVGKIYVFSAFTSSQVEAWTTYSPTYQLAVAAPAANYTASVVTYTGLTIGAAYAWKPGAHETQLVHGGVTYLSQNRFVATATTAVVTGTGAAVTFTGALSQTVSFSPEKFSVYQGQVYVRAGDNVFVYGGADNATYDACGVSGQIPYLDGDMPTAGKNFIGVDAGFEGTWQIGFSGDYNTQAFKNVYNNTVSSFQIGNIPLGGRYATHFALSFAEVGDAYARLSSAVVHFNAAAQKK